MKLSFYKVDVRNKIDEIADKVMDGLGEFYVGKVQEAVSDLYPPASEPFTPPHKRSGDLYESIEWRVIIVNGKRVLQVGSTLPYARMLELGTSQMAARPFLLVTITANFDEGERLVHQIASTVDKTSERS